MKKEAGGYSKELSSARPVARFFFCESADVPTRRRAKTAAIDSCRGEGVGRIRFSESTLRAF